MNNHYQNLTPFSPFNPLNHNQIWLGIDSHTQQKVLIKQLRKGFTSNQYKQFYQEYEVYQAVEKSSHNKQKYFAKPVDFYSKNSEYYLVLAYYHGKTLQQITGENKLAFNQKIACIIAVCTAVEAFHSLGFIHCDIKPSNVLITDHQVKLLDFGLAKVRGGNEVANNFTAGTPAYMSPEQFTGGQISVQSDYYSLGILMYEVLVGKKPFYADTIETWAIGHCQTPVPICTTFNQKQNQLCQAIFNSLLAKMPDNRANDLSESKVWLKNLLES